MSIRFFSYAENAFSLTTTILHLVLRVHKRISSRTTMHFA
jgi:hypothetical protein